MNLVPFLLFEGNCAEAMGFYQSCFGGELALTRLGDTPMKSHMPPETHSKICFSVLKSGAVEFTATDWLHPTRLPQRGNTAGMYLAGGDAAGLREVFRNLSVGADGNVFDELRETPFGIYGHLLDRYGVHWYFQSGKNQG